MNNDNNDILDENYSDYTYNQIETALIACIGVIDLKLNTLIEDIPVFLISTGDFNYFFEKKWLEIENTQINLKVPRAVLNINDIQVIQDENTQQYNKFYYIKDNIEYQASGRRVAVQVIFDLSIVSSNFLQALTNLEKTITLLISRVNVFTYTYMGNNYDASIDTVVSNNEIPSMDVSNASRNIIFKHTLTLNLQLMLPRIETLIETKEIPNKYKLEINENN